MAQKKKAGDGMVELTIYDRLFTIGDKSPWKAFYIVLRLSGVII